MVNDQDRALKVWPDPKIQMIQVGGRKNVFSSLAMKYGTFSESYWVFLSSYNGAESCWKDQGRFL